MSRSLLLGLLLALPLQLTSSDAQRISFVAHGPMGVRIEGSTHAVTVMEDGSAIVVTVPLATLETGIELRDKHMREALETDAQPLAKLRIERAAIALPAAGAESTVDVPAQLTLHGVTRPVVLHTTYKNGPSLEVSASFQIDMSSYGITPPAYLGVKVKPEVELSTTLVLAAALDGGAK